MDLALAGILHAFDDDYNEINNAIAVVFDIIEEDNRQRRIVVRDQHYFEETIPSYTIHQFKEHFRMTKSTFEDLLLVIGNNIEHERECNVPLDKKLLFTIWMLSTSESFHTAGDRFGLSKGNGHFIFKQIVECLMHLLPSYVQWPNEQLQENISTIFEARSCGISGVVGVIDGCHIPVKPPIGNANDYYNRNGFHSIILQGVCDHRKKFTDIFVGMPGSMHDARVFRKSGLFRRLSDVEHQLLRPNFHLIGDMAYPLSVNVLVPFKNTGNLTPSQIVFNTRLNSIVSIIEKAFRLLKTKFPRLKYLDIADFGLGTNIIAASCVLHNFIIDRNEVEDDKIDDIDFGFEEDDNSVEDNEVIMLGTEIKRNCIASRFE